MNKQNSPESVVGQRFADAKREWHNLSFTHLASYASGFQTPVACIPLTGNSTVVLDMQHALQTNPTATPVFDSQRVNVRVFYYPQRLCTRGLYGNNIMEINKIEEMQIPILRYTNPSSTTQVLDEDSKLYSVPLGGLLNRLGYPAGILGGSAFVPFDTRRVPSSVLFETISTLIDIEGVNEDITWNMSPVVGYFDICNHFLANPYDEEIPFPEFIYTRQSSSYIYTKDKYYNLKDGIDWNRKIKGFLSNISGGSITSIPSLFASTSGPLETDHTIVNGIWGPYGPLTLPLTETSTGDVVSIATLNETVGYYVECGSKSACQLGLFPSLYQDDRFTTFFDREEIEDLMALPISYDQTGIDDVEGLRYSKSIWNRMFRGILRGKKYSDWIEIHFGKKLPMSDHPIFCGSDHFNVVFNDVLNQTGPIAGPSSTQQPLGSSASRGQRGNGSNRTISFTALEPGYMFIILDMVPYVSYSGHKPTWLDWKTMSSFPLPEYSGYTFQDVTLADVSYMNSFDGEDIGSISYGKQPLYYEFMDSVNTLGGLFAGTLLDSYTFKRNLDLANVDSSMDLDEQYFRTIKSTYMCKGMYDYAFPDWGQNGGENYFIKSLINLRVLQPIARQVAKTRI